VEKVLVSLKLLRRRNILVIFQRVSFRRKKKISCLADKAENMRRIEDGYRILNACSEKFIGGMYSRIGCRIPRLKFQNDVRFKFPIFCNSKTMYTDLQHVGTAEDVITVMTDRYG